MNKLQAKQWLAASMIAGLATIAGPASAQTASKSEAPHQSVTPDTPTAVILSNRDTNRIVCVDGQIDGYRYSEEKGAIVDGSGGEAFIKFQIEQMGAEQKYVSVRSEFYFHCGGVTYTLLSAPANIEAQTIYLVSGSALQAKANQLRFKALPEEERAVTISLALLKGEAPVSYAVKSLHVPYDQHILERMDVRPVKEVSVVGTRYSAREYLLRARRDVALNERDFLKPFFGASIYAVTFDRLTLKAGEVGRVVLVYRGEQS